MTGAQEIAQRLADSIEAVAETLLGKPATRTAHEMRWGRRGSLWVSTHGNNRGRFADHERAEGGDALDLVRYARGCDLRDAMAWSRDFLGDTNRPSFTVVTRAPIDSDDGDDRRRTERAMQIWQQRSSLVGSPAETYLRGRRITDLTGVHDLAFHPRCPVGSGSQQLPCMLALMRDAISNEPRALHRTWLRPDGSGKADVAALGLPRDKMMLGPTRGTVVKLSPDDTVETGLHIGEGIETILSAWQQGFRPVWAAADAGHIAKFPVLDGVETLTIFADNDANGAGQNAASECTKRWVQAGRTVRVITPRGVDTDWNDLLRAAA